LDAIAEYDTAIRERTDPLVGRAYATVTAFEAGVGSNRGVVPERARITLDRRILPSESIADIDTEVDELLQDTEAEHDIVTDWTRETTYESAEIPIDSPLAETFRTHAHPDSFGVQVATDVRNFVNDADIEAITWGPGSIEQAHTRDEFVDLEAVTTGLEVLQTATRDLLQS
jgi:succinyl-diaminopimelate desuccinylase